MVRELKCLSARSSLRKNVSPLRILSTASRHSATCRLWRPPDTAPRWCASGRFALDPRLVPLHEVFNGREAVIGGASPASAAIGTSRFARQGSGTSAVMLGASNTGSGSALTRAPGPPGYVPVSGAAMADGEGLIVAVQEVE